MASGGGGDGELGLGSGKDRIDWEGEDIGRGDIDRKVQGVFAGGGGVEGSGVVVGVLA